MREALTAALLVGLATSRATRLVMIDSFPFARLRKWAVRSAPRWLDAVLTCPWCLSGWLSLAGTTAAALVASVPLPALAWFAAWWVAAAANRLIMNVEVGP